MKIAIIDYGASNLQSVANALTTLGRSFEIIDDPKKLTGFDKVILPGVGAAASTMEKLIKSGFTEILPKLKVPTLGVCLGLQLFADYSEEGNVKCLSIIPGMVKKFQTELKVPHMGWNKLEFIKKSSWFNGIDDIPYFYFVHSYFVTCHDKNDVLATTFYDHDFVSVINRENIFGVQFHTEKSHQQGIRLLHNFCNL